MADKRRVFFMNINKKFLDSEGRLSNEIAPDFLHLSRKGYQIWADAIEDEVRRLMEM
jgi:lysophospholipase L1-like esterase